MSNIGSKEAIFSKTKQKNHSKSHPDQKHLSLHNALDHFVFLYFFTACLRQGLPYIIKDVSSEGL